MSTKVNLLESNDSIISKGEGETNFNAPINSLEPSKSRAISLVGEEILKSKKNHLLEFTNFLNKSTETACYNTLYKVVKDLNLGYVKNLIYEMDEGFQSEFIPKKLENRILNILRLYPENSDIMDLSSVSKLKVESYNQQKVAFRIFVNITPTHFQIILLDPLHFVMPSSRQYTKGGFYSDHKSNNICMSKIIKADEELNRIYSSLNYN